MSAIVLYRSSHHGNTKRLVDRLVSKYHVESHALDEKEFDLSSYDTIGLASGVYAFQLDPALLSFAESNDWKGKRVFVLYTSASGGKKYAKRLLGILKEKGAEILGVFQCRGFCTFGPFKIFHGINKNHPDEKDLAKLEDFFEEKVYVFSNPSDN